MRFTIHNLLKAPVGTLVPMVIALSAILSSPAYALKSDREQPINVESVEQSADLQANKLVFSGDVVATQGSIKVKADKIEITRNNDGTLKSIIAYGSPTTFEQQQDNGRYIRSRSSTLSYMPQETNINSQKMRAYNNNSQGGRVSSTFVPADFKKD